MTTLHLTHAQIIDPEAGTVSPGSVTLANGVIAAINGPKPKGAKEIDCGGHHLGPGIVDIGVKIGNRGNGTRNPSALPGWRPPPGG